VLSVLRLPSLHGMAADSITRPRGQPERLPGLP